MPRVIGRLAPASGCRITLPLHRRRLWFTRHLVPVRSTRGSRATTTQWARGLSGIQVSGRARRTQAPIGSRRGITKIVTIQVIGDTGNGAGIAMTTSAGSTMTAGCTVVGTGATGTTKGRPLTGKRRGGLSLVENSETKLGILWSRPGGPESASNGEYERAARRAFADWCRPDPTEPK